MNVESPYCCIYDEKKLLLLMDEAKNNCDIHLSIELLKQYMHTALNWGDVHKIS